MLGHEGLLKIFKDLIKAEKLSQSYIFFGQEGVGKKTFALTLASFLENKKQEFEQNKALNDFIFISPGEENSLGIDRIREIKNFLFQRPNVSRYRTVVVDRAETLTTEAQNALLKISEEPPQAALIILIVRDLNLLMPTILSRFQTIYFSILKLEVISKWLINDFSLEEKKAKEISQASFGRPGLAWRLVQDQNFLSLKKQAEEFVSSKTSTSSKLIKDLVDDENFKLPNFLDAVIETLVASGMYAKNFKFWHRVLELRRKVDYAPLNPRLQLEDLSRM